ncbi:MAG: hypothetical protein ACRDWD_03535 [Acidimicrobiia bacterium]
MTARLLRRLDDALSGPESGARLLVVWTGLAVLIALRVALGPYWQLAGQPPALFRPVPFLRWLDSMPALGVIVAIQVVGTALAVASALGWRRRLVFILAWVCFLLLAGMRASRGKILHNDLVLLFASVPFLAAPEDVRYSDGTPNRRFGWPVRSALAVIALSYFLTGYWKLRNSGLDWVTSDNLRWVLWWGPATAESRVDWIAEFVAQRPWLSHLGAAGILGFELLFPVVLFWPRIRPLFAVGAVVFHAGTYLVLGLDYWSYAAVAVLLLVDWPRVWLRVARRRRPSPAPVPS